MMERATVSPAATFPSDMAEYKRVYQESIRDPDAFWTDEASRLDWEGGPPPRADPKHNFVAPGVSVQWFKEGRTNACHNALDRWVIGGHGDRPCFHCEQNADARETLTYNDILAMVQRAANVLLDAGVQRGQRVIIYLPMIAELPVAMLACARIGAVHAVVFAGFSAEALAERIVAAGAEVVLTCEYAIRGTKVIPLKQIADDAVDIATERGHKVRTVFVVDAKEKAECNVPLVPDRDINWNEAMEAANPKCDIVWMGAEEPLFVLYTSGSTGKPKGVVHTTAGYLVYAQFTTRYGFNFHGDRDVWFCTADCGWITGHSYFVYGPMLNGATQVMLGGTPTYPSPDRLWSIVDRYKVTHLYTAPTAVRALMGLKPPPGGQVAADWVRAHNTSSLRILGSVGEPIGAEAWRWYRDVVGGARPDVRVVDTFWQTETGGIMVVSIPLTDIPEKPGCAMLPMPGIVPVLLTRDGKEVQGAESGLLAFKTPWPGMLRTTWGDHKRMESTYFPYPGYYLTGDGARRDEDGHLWLTGRADDVLSVSGHRIGSAEVETAICTHPAVAESAVVGRPHPVKGEALYAFVTLRSGATPDEETRTAIRQQVRKAIGSFAAPDVIHWAPGLPKTRSGKIMRRILRTIAVNGTDTDLDALGDTSTLADPSVVHNLLSGVDK